MCVSFEGLGHNWVHHILRPDCFRWEDVLDVPSTKLNPIYTAAFIRLVQRLHSPHLYIVGENGFLTGEPAQRIPSFITVVGRVYRLRERLRVAQQIIKCVLKDRAVSHLHSAGGFRLNASHPNCNVIQGYRNLKCLIRDYEAELDIIEDSIGAIVLSMTSAERWFYL